MRSDLIGSPVVGPGEKIFIIRAVYLVGTNVMLVLEDETGHLTYDDLNDVRMLVPQVMSSYSATSLTELFPDLLNAFGRREIVQIWTLGLGFDGPLRERIKYGILAFKEGKEGELATIRSMRDQGASLPWVNEPKPEG